MIRNERFEDGVCVEAEIIDLDAGTVAYEVDGKVVESRQLTPDEAAQFAPPPPSAEERLADLLTDLSKATTLAQVRAAAVNAKERTRLPVSESPSVRDSPRE